MLMQVHGGAKLHLRSMDSRFMAFVDSWWSVLLPKIAPYVYKNGGPILMVQASQIRQNPDYRALEPDN